MHRTSPGTPKRCSAAPKPPLARDRFALDPSLVYLNHAATGVLPIVTRDAVVAFANDHAREGGVGAGRYEAQLDRYRSEIAATIGAGGDEIAVLRNVSEGANVVALGLDWEPGDEIVLSDNEFGANAYPWLALRERGVVIRFVETARERMTPAVLARIMSSRTKLVAVSWVSFTDGYRHDLDALAAIARKGGAWFVVDGIQALGAFPLDVRATGIDAFFGAGAKWLMALQGVGFLYVAPRLAERLALRIPGWRSAGDMWDFLAYEQPPSATIARFEGGTPNFIGALALATSCGVLREARLATIAEHVLALTDDLVERLRACGARIYSSREQQTGSAIVTFALPGCDSLELGRRLQTQGYVTTHRASGIRVSPHGYTTHDEIAAFAGALTSVKD